MPPKCYVPGCNNTFSHRIPKNPDKRALWLEAIGRPGDDPKPGYGICSDHFTKDDFATVGWDTNVPIFRKWLKRDAVPSVGLPELSSKRHCIRGTQPMNDLREFENTPKDFEDNSVEEFILPDQLVRPDNVTVKTDVASETNAENIPGGHAATCPNVTIDSKLFSSGRMCEEVMPAANGVSKVGQEFILPDQPSLPDLVSIKTEIFDETSATNIDEGWPSTCSNATVDSKILSSSDLCEERLPADEGISNVIDKDKNNVVTKAVQCDKPSSCDVRTQTIGTQANYTIFDYQDKPDVVQYFTGLDSFPKFMSVFKSLKTEYNKVVYPYKYMLSISLEDQLFMTLWKLRTNAPDFELAVHFAVSQATVSNIVTSFVAFMAKQWGDRDTWPQKSLVDLYMPENFKKSRSSARVVPHKTQVPSKEPSGIGETKASPKSLVTVNNKHKMLIKENDPSSDPTAQKGSNVASQVVENCDVPALKKCKVRDLIIVDRSFNVKDLFGSKGVVISIPRSLKDNDPNLERLIGHAVSYKILVQQLNPLYEHIASEIFYVCVMLCHYCFNTIVEEP